MADETTRVDQWLQATLTAAPALAGGRVYADLAPQGAAYPLVVHQHQGSVDVRTATGDGRIMISGLWLVRAVVQAATYLGDAVSLADQIDLRLEEASGTAGVDGVVCSCTREAPFRLAEADQGVHYRHLGGLYRVYAQVP